MKKLFILFTALFSFSIFAAQVPIEDFADKSKFQDLRISPDGEHIAFTYEEGTQGKLAIMNLDSRKIIQAFEVGDEREVSSFFWGSNDRIIMLGTDITGWLDGKAKKPLLLAANIDGTKRNQMWDFQRSGLNAVSRLDSDPKKVLLVKRHYADQGNVTLVKMNIFNSKIFPVGGLPRTTGGSDAFISAIDVDSNDEPRFALERDPKNLKDFYDDVNILHVKPQGGEWKTLPLEMARSGSPNLSGVGFSKDNDKYYFLSNHDLSDEGVLGLFEFNFLNDKITKLFRHPDVDVQVGVFGANGEVIGARYEAGYPEYFYLTDDDVKAEVDFHKALVAGFKGQNAFVTSYSADGSLATVRVYSDKQPGNFYLFNRSNNEASYLASSMPKIKPEQMSVVEPFTLNARDGLKMYGQMTIPNGKKLKDLPMVVFPHGGPYGAYDSWRWDSRTQLLASRGYLVLQLNFRGSGGYGDKFQDEGKGEWGERMQDDLTDATKWAISNGYADAERVCIHGVSYGGYAALHAVVKEPDLYKCSIPDAGVYDIALQFKKADTFSGMRAGGKGTFLKYMLGDDYQNQMIKQSPAQNVDKIKAALLLVHGTEDVRVPIENAYFLEKQLTAAGKPYDTIYKKDGHGFQKVEYRIELYNKMLEFLDTHIGEKK